MAKAAGLAERSALAAIRADSEDAVGASRARPRLSVRAPLRRLARRIRAGAAAQSELLRWRRRFYGLSLSYSGRWQEADEAARRALRLSPRDPYSAVYLGIAAYAQFLGRNYDEAIRLSREAIRQRSDFVGAHRVLTAAAGMAGQTDVAKAALKDLQRAQPNISLAWISDHMPIRNGAGPASLSRRIPARRTDLDPGRIFGDLRSFYFENHILDLERRELRRGSDLCRARTAGVRPADLSDAEPRPGGEQGRSASPRSGAAGSSPTRRCRPASTRRARRSATAAKRSA